MWLLLAGAAVAGEFDDDKYVNWHQWRGPDATGVATQAEPPLTWSEENNIRFKIEVPGRGSSTPIIWGDRLFLLTSIDTGQVDASLPKPEEQPERLFGITFPNTIYQFVVLCIDRHSGRELWRSVAVEKVPHEGHHGDNNYASGSPTTDGERLYAWFGSAGLYCYDLDGKLLWQRDLGKVETRRSFGEGSSPVIHDGRLVITRDHEGESYIIALNATTGETLWQVERDEPSAWATPLVVEFDGRTQVVTSASNRVRSYDLVSGELIWQCGGQVGNVTPSPVTDGKFVFCMSGYRGSALFALPLDAAGDITDTEKIVWSKDRGTPYVPSPLLYEGLLYFNQSNDAILTCLQAETGETVLDRTRLRGLRSIYASPLGAAGRIYLVGRDGATLVLERGAEFKVLATNHLSDGFDASPVAVGKQLYLRGQKHLYCITEED
jgi:outer membrane protein assembly factor BamB